MPIASSSRLGTPIPSRMHDQDLNGEDLSLESSGNPYDEYGPYDMDFTASVTRPPPVPYDDPYSDVYGTEAMNPTLDVYQHAVEESPRRPMPSGRRRGRGKDRKLGEQHPVQTSPRRVRGRGRGHWGRGRGHISADFVDDDGYSDQFSSPSSHSSRTHARISSQQISPTTARATGQLSEESVPIPHTPTRNAWQMQQQVPYPSPYSGYHHPVDPQGFPAQYVQPHINPRFASAFGFNIGQSPIGIQRPYTQVGLSESPSTSRVGVWPAYKEMAEETHEADPS